MPPMPARGGRAAGFGHALDRKARGFGFAGAALEFGRRGNFAIEQIEIGELARQQRGIGETDIFVVGRDARHRDRALGELRDAVAGDVVGRDHGLALPDQHAQADIVAFGALGFLDPAVAHFDALRDAAHRNRVGGVRARALGGLDQPLRQRRERRLIEQVGGRAELAKAAKCWMVKSSQTKSLTLKRAGNANRQAPPDVPDLQGFQAFCVAKCQTFSALPQGLVNHVRQGLVNHAAQMQRRVTLGLTSLFKPKRKPLG